MFAGLTSKLRLAVAVCAAACGVGGCGADGTASARAGAPPTPRVSVASADDNGDAGPSQSAEPEAASAVSQSDVIGWVARGTADDVILDRIRRAPNAVHLTAADELQLRDAGVTDQVIRALEATGWN